MMIRRRRGHVVVTSDSSSDSDCPKTSINKRHSTCSNEPNSAYNLRPREQRKSQSQADSTSDTESDSSFVITPRKRRKKRLITTSNESHSSDNESLNPLGSGGLRALSDYESGGSTKQTGRTSNGNGAPSRLASIVRNGEDYESSSDDSVIVSHPIKRRLTCINSTDSSDSGMPNNFFRCRKRMRIISSGESDSSELSDLENSRSVANNRTTRDSNRPSTSRDISPRYRTNRRVLRRTRYQEAISRTFRSSSESSDDLLRPRAPSSFRIPVFSSDSSSSSTESTSSDSDGNDNFSLENRLTRLSQFDSGERNNSNMVAIDIKASSTPKLTVSKDTYLGNSSDSDGESEKCPICFSHFRSQEIGIPAKCDHCFCVTCIEQWAKTNNTCPVDRQVFNSITVHAHFQGKVIRQIPVETPLPNVPLIDNITIFLGQYDDNENSSSDYDSNSDGPLEMCCVCRRRNYYSDLIFCDSCHHVFHMDCLEPPLRYIPVSDWFCPECVALSNVAAR